MNDNNLKISFTILNRLCEMQRALENKMYISALIIALTIPDILGAYECGSDSNVGYRYKKICIDELDYSEQVANKIYKLRCSFLHENSTYENKGFTKIVVGGAEDDATLSVDVFCNRLEQATINYLKMHKELINKEQEQKNILNFSDDEALSQKLQEEMKFYLDDIFENKEESKNEN
ncbi:hypothetical protein KTQ89_11095 [Holdemanella porci]|uniref:hypothetical protein n=1 Tax=Holdemanella porci TaxID=2652276 RepID=UPI001C2BF9DD|nr:hypothetical protein [Holdemanella porci]MBU9872891.1 hypothetical protein [Holdemanella porci]